MKFKSTRGGVRGISFEEAVLSGIPLDGGLFMPEELPTLSKAQMRAWSKLSYPQLVREVLRVYADQEEMSDGEIDRLMDGCYDKFDDPDTVISTVIVGPLTFAELWHGPTGAFKDFPLPVIARVVNFFLEKRQRRSTVLVSTSGDTGSAAIHSVLGLQQVQLMVMFPRHMISRTQRLQMTTVSAPNVRVFSLDGTSGDADVVMKKLFMDADFTKKHNLNVFNSLNFCRLMVQSAYFMFLYLQQCPEVDQELLFFVPTGGMSNLSSGMLAHNMGFPIRFVAAVNINDVVHRVLEKGVYEVSPVMHKTLSSAMDVVIPYNMERLFHSFSRGDSGVVSRLMCQFEETGSCTLPPSLMEANTAVSSVCVLEDAVLATMREVWQQYGYLLCPHTAVATRVALDLLQSRQEGRGTESPITSPCEKIVVLSTATPAKFAEAVERAGLVLPPSPKFSSLEELSEKEPIKMDKGEDWELIIRKEIEMAWNV